jgi:very-short-patch-repair endonuclease
LNDFEADIFDTLTAEGLKLIPQLGTSQFRIDMVAEHPIKPGRLVLAIECDGATYHSSYTARDRDRLRQQHLEKLGWRFHRIWSTDWFMHKSEEVQRAMQAFQLAVQYADSLDIKLGQNEGPIQTQDNNAGQNGSGRNGTGRQRGPRPSVTSKPSVELYCQTELVKLIKWILSDGKLRTDAEIVREMVTELGFSRRGIRIEAAIDSALKAYRSMNSQTATSETQ